MQLKVFKLNSGKLQFTGIREVRQGDAIIEGEISIEEVIREASTSDFPLYFKPAPPTEAELAKARKSLKAEAEVKGKADLKAALKRAMPGISDQGLDAAVNLKRQPAPW